jgi:hypothetical protein
VIAHDANVIALEVKSGAMGRMRSLLQFLKEKDASTGLRISADPRIESHKVEGGRIVSLPFYLVSKLNEILKQK